MGDTKKFFTHIGGIIRPWAQVRRMSDDDKSEVIVAEMGGFGTDFMENAKNAQLFAAAPDMLEALQRCISTLQANDAPNCEAVKEAKAAIAKAEGR